MKSSRVRIVVVLPAPFGPRYPKTSPRITVNVRSVTPVTLSRTYMWPCYAPDGRLPSGTNRLSRGELPDSGLTFVRVDFGDDP
jgi:hypothetical protein